MENVRGHFQGVTTILRFNWHFYVLAFVLLSCAGGAVFLLPPLMKLVLLLGVGLGCISVVASLLVSYYVYDYSPLYTLAWLDGVSKQQTLSVSAGFDETSDLFLCRFPESTLTRCDFYDPQLHTELSIKRARKAFPPAPSMVSVTTSRLPFPTGNYDMVLAVLSAHEIRDEQERITFFRELGRVTKDSGRIVVAEHVRDLQNFAAYTIGAFHFHSRSTWLRTFKGAQLQVDEELKITPFITLFILRKP